MKKILILTSKITKKKKVFTGLLRQNFAKGKTKISINRIRNVFIKIEGSEIFAQVGGKDMRIFDPVCLRGILPKDVFLATTVALALKHLRVKFYDTLYLDAGPQRNKLSSLIILADGDIPVPPTIYFADGAYLKHFKKLSESLGLPFVAKEMSLQRGKGVHLIKSSQDLKNLPAESKGGSRNEYFFQKFINKDHEYRILVLGEKVGVWEEKIAQKKGEFRHNVALGAKEIFLDPKKIPSRLAKVARASARALNIQIAGVDLMTEEGSGKVYVLEVNRGPGLTYDEKISPEFKAIARFLEND